MVEIIRAVNHKNRPFALKDHVTSFVWKWKLYDFAFKKPLVGQNNSDLVFQTPHHFLQISKFVAGHVTKCDFFKTTNYLFPNRNFALKLQGNCWKDDVVTFSAKSDRKYQTFNKIQAKSSFGHHVGGQEYTLQNGGQYKSYYFVGKSKCHKISPLNVFPLKLRV